MRDHEGDDPQGLKPTLVTSADTSDVDDKDEEEPELAEETAVRRR